MKSHRPCMVFILVWLSLILLGFSMGWSQTKPEERFKGETLIVTTWSGPYEKSFRTVFVDPFEKQYGVKIELVPGWYEFIPKILSAPKGQPPYDVFLATDRSIIQVKTHLEKLRRENIPNFQRMWDYTKELDGFKNNLGAPFDSGFMTMAFRSDLIKFNPTSWKDFTRPDLKKLVSFDSVFFWNLYPGGYIADRVDKKGKVVLEPIDPIYKKMEEIASTNIYKWYGSGAEFVSLLERGEVHGGYGWSGSLYLQKAKGMKLLLVIPKEGTVAYVDYLCVLQGTKKRDLAEFFINYCLSEEPMTRFVELQKNSVSNKNVKIPAELKGTVLGSEAEWEKLQLVDWDYVMPRWKELEERWKKEVLPLVK